MMTRILIYMLIITLGSMLIEPLLINYDEQSYWFGFFTVIIMELADKYIIKDKS